MGRPTAGSAVAVRCRRASRGPRGLFRYRPCILVLDGFGDVFLFASQVLELLFICFVIISCYTDDARYVFTEVVRYVFSRFARGADARHQRART